MKRIPRTILTLALAVILCMSLCMAAFAHSLTIESLGGTYVSFCYSDGTPCKGAKIIVQDASGAALGSGKTTSQGIYNYAEYEGTAAKIVMNDGEGHVGEYEVPAVTPEVTDRTPVEKTGDAAAAAPADTGENADASASTAEESAAPASSGGMSAGTIAAVVVVVVALLAIAFLAAKRSRKKQ